MQSSKVNISVESRPRFKCKTCQLWLRREKWKTKKKNPFLIGKQSLKIGSIALRIVLTNKGL